MSDLFYSLVPLEEFMALMGIDDREEKMARFCLASAAFAIERFCLRRFLRMRCVERIEFYGDLRLPLREYPVTKITEVWGEGKSEEGKGKREERLRAELYRVVPDCGADEDIPFSIELSPALLRCRGLSAIKVVYWAGYWVKEKGTGNREWCKKKNVPADLGSACFELAAWNMNRYKGRRIGLTGNVRGKGRDGEHFEMAMPENVRALLEPYRRKTI